MFATVAVFPVVDNTTLDTNGKLERQLFEKQGRLQTKMDSSYGVVIVISLTVIPHIIKETRCLHFASTASHGSKASTTSSYVICSCVHRGA